MIDLVPKTLVGWLCLVGFITMALTVIYFNWKNQSVKMLREQVDDQDNRIKFLEAEQKRSAQTIEILNSKMHDLKFKKNYLKQIVVEALASKKSVDSQLIKQLSSHELNNNTK